MDKKTYKELERMLAHHKLHDDVDDVLLEMAETLADENVVGEKMVVTAKFGKVKIEACGICTPNEDDPELTDVYVEWIQIGTERIEIADYIM